MSKKYTTNFLEATKDSNGEIVISKEKSAELEARLEKLEK
jgi:hypothetical protein